MKIRDVNCTASQELRKFEAKRMCDMILSLARSRSSDMKSWKDGDEEDSSLSKTRDLALPTNWHGMDGSEWTIMRSASLHNPISRFVPSDCPMHSSEFFFPPLLQLTSHYLTFFHALFPLSMQSTISMTFIQKSRQNSDRPIDGLRFSPQINVDFCIFIPSVRSPGSGAVSPRSEKNTFHSSVISNELSQL